MVLHNNFVYLNMRSVFATIFIGICALFVYGGKQSSHDLSFNKSVSIIQQTHGQNLAAFNKIKGHNKKTHLSAVKYKKSKVKGLKNSEITLAISFLKKVVCVNKKEPILIQNANSSFLHCVDQKRGPPCIKFKSRSFSVGTSC